MSYIDPDTTGIRMFPYEATLDAQERKIIFLEEENRRKDEIIRLLQEELDRRDFPEQVKYSAGSMFSARTSYLRDWMIMKDRSWSNVISVDTNEVVMFFLNEVEWSVRFNKKNKNLRRKAREIMINLGETDSRFETFLDGDAKKVLVLKYKP